MAPRASVVLSTFNQPRLLELVLASYARQSCVDFEILIADDGSGRETAAVIERSARGLPLRIEHVWQPDEGFRKSEANNRAVLRSRGEQLIFSDGDCLASRTFVEEHLALARAGRYVVGGHIRLTKEFTDALTLDGVRRGDFERAGSLLQKAELWLTHAKSLAYIALRKHRKPKLYGMNFSVDRESFFRVNGFDNTYRNSGREDSDLRNRLQLGGVQARSLWHRARVFHLHHPPHLNRMIWKAVAEYYDRPDLEAVAPTGLREVSAEEAGASRGELRAPSPLRSV